MAEFAEVLKINAPKYLKSAFDATLRKRILWAMAKKKGRIKTGYSSHSLYWQAEVEEVPVQTYGDFGVLDYESHDTHRQYNIAWKGYSATSAITLKQREMNQGDTRLIAEEVAHGIPKLTRSVMNKLSEEFYQDGTSDPNRFNGIPSFMGKGTTVVGDKIIQPSDTYAGHSTAVGVDGTWSSNLGTSPNAAIATDWPDGTGDPEYSWNSPQMWNTVSTAWTGTNTFAANCERVFREALSYNHVLSGSMGSPDNQFIVMTAAMFNTFRNAIADDRRIMVQHKASQDLGFGEVLNYDGAGMYFDYGVPADTFYGFNWEGLEVAILGKDVLKIITGYQDPRRLADLYAVAVLGNFKFMPKCFFMGYAEKAS